MCGAVLQRNRLSYCVFCYSYSYDYSGYGMSAGKPSEKNLYADIDAAWHALRNRYAILLQLPVIGAVITSDWIFVGMDCPPKILFSMAKVSERYQQ